jgi:glycerol-3-phosphate dehydrogenase
MTQPNKDSKQKQAQVQVQVQVGSIAHKRVHPSRHLQFQKDLEKRIQAALGVKVFVIYHGGATTNVFAISDGKLEGNGITANQRDMIHTIVLDMLMS